MTGYAVGTLLLVFIAATCLFGVIKGGAAERLGAAIILGNLLAGMVNQANFQSDLFSLSNNGITAILLLILAIRYASFWLGGVMLLYGLQFALHAAYFVLERKRDALFANLNNINFVLVSVCLLAGTIVAVRRRRGQRASETVA